MGGITAVTLLVATGGFVKQIKTGDVFFIRVLLGLQRLASINNLLFVEGSVSLQ